MAWSLVGICDLIIDMRIEVLNTGTELLLGNTVNTHGAWIGRALFPLGLRVTKQTTVPDGEAIREAIGMAIERSDALVVTGGLGPTSDDLTRDITSEVMGVEMIEDEAALRSIESLFALRGRPMSAVNRKQANCPVGADVLPNPNGTAPGIYVPPRLNGKGACAVFLLPGPPRELYPMFETEVVPRLRALSGMDVAPSVRELKFTGIGESDFHQMVDDALHGIADLEHGYCAHIGEVDLRLIGSTRAISAGEQIALNAFSDFLVSNDGSSMEETVVRLARKTGKQLATAESCTGGMIANRITNVPGSSEVFTGGFVTYSNQAKISQLGVSEESLANHGAVSSEVAAEMADGALKAMEVDLAVSMTGIAGPGGGSDEKPIGTAWLGLAVKGEPVATCRVYQPRNRHDFKLAVSQAALDVVRKVLISR